MAAQPQCEACKGSGLGARQGEEARADIWPILSQRLGLCEKCGGSGHQPKPSHATNVSQAKSAAG